MEAGPTREAAALGGCLLRGPLGAETPSKSPATFMQREGSAASTAAPEPWRRGADCGPWAAQEGILEQPAAPSEAQTWTAASCSSPQQGPDAEAQPKGKGKGPPLPKGKGKGDPKGGKDKAEQNGKGKSEGEQKGKGRGPLRAPPGPAAHAKGKDAKGWEKGKGSQKGKGKDGKGWQPWDPEDQQRWGDDWPASLGWHLESDSESDHDFEEGGRSSSRPGSREPTRRGGEQSGSEQSGRGVLERTGQRPVTITACLLSGRSVEVRADGSATVWELRAKLHEMGVRAGTLLLGHEQLQDDSSLEQCGIGDGAHLQVLVPFQLKIQALRLLSMVSYGLNGRFFPTEIYEDHELVVDVNATDTIDGLVRRLLRERPIEGTAVSDGILRNAIEKVELSYDGVTLDGHRTLSEYNIFPGSAITLTDTTTAMPELGAEIWTF